MLLTGALALGLAACVDDNDWGTDSNYNRAFSAHDIQVTPSATTATVTFDALSSVDYYLLELNTDSLYLEEQHEGSRIETITSSPYVIEGLSGETKYFLRIRAYSKDGAQPSLWSYYEDGDLRSFVTDGEQIFYTIATADVTSSTIRLSWLEDAEVTRIVYYVADNPDDAGTERTLTADDRTWYCLQDICRSGGIAAEEHGDSILLRESGLTVELRLGDPYLRRDGLLMNSMTAAPMAQDGLVWVSPEVLSRLFTGGKGVTPSLYRAVYFYEEEVLAAIADPETEHNHLVLEQVSLPTSMGIELVRVDRSRIFQDTPVADLSPLFASDLEYWGFADPGSLCYTEYTVAESAQTLQTLLDKLYAEDPDLAPYNPFDSSYDPALWTLGEYNRCKQESRDPWLAAGLDRSDPADAERIRFLEERDILPGDLFALQKVFFNEYMAHSDAELREAIEARYQLELFGPGA